MSDWTPPTWMVPLVRHIVTFGDTSPEQLLESAVGNALSGDSHADSLACVAQVLLLTRLHNLGLLRGPQPAEAAGAEGSAPRTADRTADLLHTLAERLRGVMQFHPEYTWGDAGAVLMAKDPALAAAFRDLVCALELDRPGYDAKTGFAADEPA